MPILSTDKMDVAMTTQKKNTYWRNLHAGLKRMNARKHIRKLKDKWAALWENQQSAYAKTKAQISFAVTAKLISAFVFASRIVQFLLYLTPKFQASSLLLC